MPVMSARICAALVVTLSLGAARAQTVEAELAEGAALAASAKKVEAAKAFGKAAALAHKANDVFAEQLVAAKLSAAVLGGPPSSHGDVIAAVLGALDPKRAGAYVSARALAADLLFEATREGQTGHVAEAAKALAAATAAPKSGKAVKALAAYAKGLQAVAAGKGAASIDPLTETLTVAAAEDWIDVAFHAGTELAAQAIATGRPEAAAAALTIVSKLFTPTVDRDHVQNWRKLVKNRLAGAPPEVMAPYDEAMKPFGGGTSSGAGGKGGRGQVPGGKSKLGRVWDGLSPTAAIATAKRVDDGFELTFAYEGRMKQPLGPGLDVGDEGGGVMLVFHGRGVALAVLDLIGTAGQPGGTSYLSAGTPLYRLAKGETWSVSRQGIVTISGP
jgi:hypothetical protein